MVFQLIFGGFFIVGLTFSAHAVYIESCMEELKKIEELQVLAEVNKKLEQAKAVGMNGHIAKPIDIKILMHTLKKVLCQEGRFHEESGKKRPIQEKVDRMSVKRKEK